MIRTEHYIANHPELRELFDLIQNVKGANNVTVTVTTGTPHCQVINKLENPYIDINYFSVNNIDEATLLIQGKKTYSFGLSGTKFTSIESNVGANGTVYTIKLTQLGSEYIMIFLLDETNEIS